MLVRTAPVRDQPFTFFPSVGEYPVYDDVIYDGFGADDARRRAYRAAIQASARGRVVLDIGTGRDALWAVEAVRAGAGHVYAVEAQPATAAQARQAVARAGVASQVTVIEGRSEQITVPQPAQVCVCRRSSATSPLRKALLRSSPTQRGGCAPRTAPGSRTPAGRGPWQWT